MVNILKAIIFGDDEEEKEKYDKEFNFKKVLEVEEE